MIFKRRSSYTLGIHGTRILMETVRGKLMNVKMTALTLLAVASIASTSVAAPSATEPGKERGEAASTLGGSISDHVTGGASDPGTGTATVKSGGNNQNGGRQ